jgi:hypothetical protein
MVFFGYAQELQKNSCAHLLINLSDVALRFVLERHVGWRVQKFGMLAVMEFLMRVLLGFYSAQIVCSCDESVVDDCAMCDVRCAMCDVEKGDDDVADGRVWACASAPEIGAPLVRFVSSMMVDQVKPLLDIVTCKSSIYRISRSCGFDLYAVSSIAGSFIHSIIQIYCL